MALSEMARVLITVKASPEPSMTHGDTVCVAGIRLDVARPRWIRLYPVPFRYLDENQQFKKYEIVDVEITKARKDPRLESYSPNLATIRRTGSLKKADRPNHVLPLVDRTMCEVQRDLDSDINGPSLAVVRARSIERLVVDRHPGWTVEERRRLDLWASAPDLFGTPKTRTLQAPRLRAVYEWHCESPNCGGHKMRMLDWELTALQRRFSSLSDAELVDVVRTNFLTKMFPSMKTPHFFVGNFASGPKRKSFSILGAFPSEIATPDVPLFD